MILSCNVFLQDLIDAHAAFAANIEVAQGEYQGLVAVAEQIDSLGGGGRPNPYSQLTIEVRN